jgi:hypothetical protein
MLSVPSALAGLILGVVLAELLVPAITLTSAATRQEQRASQRKGGGKRSHPSKQRIDLAGQRFGRLVVLDYADSNYGATRWRCRCDCGNETIVASRMLRIGDTKSCGCLRREMSRLNLLRGRP